jgi:hypothetical protein
VFVVNLYNYIYIYKNKGKLHLPPLNFGHFCRYPSMFKTSHLGVSKFDFFSFFSFCIENHNRMSVLPQNYASFWDQCSYGVRSKIGIEKNFLYVMGKVRENKSLIHLNESF